MSTKIMLIGLGDLGSITLELLAREPEIEEIVVASRNIERTAARCNLALLGALAQGYTPGIRFISLDLTHHEATAEAIYRENPDLIYSTATTQTWWYPNLLPPPQAELFNRAGFGVWLPVHFTLSRSLMEATKLAAFKGHVLTAPFPDVVNYILGKLNLAPTSGVGNLDEIVPKIRYLTADKFETEISQVRVWLVAHHALQSYVFGEARGEPPPNYLRVELDGADITEHVSDLLFASLPLASGPVTHFLTAGSTVRLVRALLHETDTFLHVPAPGGLPGGYPVLASRRGVRLAEIPGLESHEAIAINNRSHRFDGIERIEEDGTAIFDSASVEILRDTLGYDCPRLHPAEAEARASELIARFRTYAAQYGVNV
jgi:hypothetical protein